MKKSLVRLVIFILLIVVSLYSYQYIKRISSPVYKVGAYLDHYGWSGAIHEQTPEDTQKVMNRLTQSGRIKEITEVSNKLGIAASGNTSEGLKLFIVNDLKKNGKKLDETNLLIELQIFFQDKDYSNPKIAGLYIQKLYSVPAGQKDFFYLPLNVTDQELNSLIENLNAEAKKSRQ